MTENRDVPERGSMPSVDGRMVSRAINARMRPLLREAGFDQFSGRRAWRSSEHTIEQVVFRSFNAYIAYGVGCTTFSFGCDLGVFYRTFDPDKDRPKEYDCQFYASLGKVLPQPFFNPYETGELRDRGDVWYVLEDGSNLDVVIEDAANCLITQGFPYLDKMRDPARAFEALRTEQSVNGYSTFGTIASVMPGAPGSPAWRQTAAGVGRLVFEDPEDAIWSAPVLAEK